MTARPRKKTESLKECIRAFTSGETHAKHTSEHYQIKDHDSLLKAILEVNLSLFSRYLVDQGIKVHDFDNQKMFAKIYTDLINAILIDFIECNERGELG